MKFIRNCKVSSNSPMLSNTLLLKSVAFSLLKLLLNGSPATVLPVPPPIFQCGHPFPSNPPAVPPPPVQLLPASCTGHKFSLRCNQLLRQSNRSFSPAASSHQPPFRHFLLAFLWNAIPLATAHHSRFTPPPLPAPTPLPPVLAALQSWRARLSLAMPLHYQPL